MNLDKLSPAEQVIATGGAFLLAFSFVPWYGYAGANHNAWDNTFSGLAVIVAMVMVVQIILARLTTASLPTLPFSWGRVHLILGITVVVLLIVQYLLGDCAPALVGEDRVCVAWFRRYGLLFGLLAALVLAYGGIRRSLEPDTRPDPAP